MAGPPAWFVRRIACKDKWWTFTRFIILQLSCWSHFLWFSFRQLTSFAALGTVHSGACWPSFRSSTSLHGGTLRSNHGRRIGNRVDSPKEARIFVSTLRVHLEPWFIKRQLSRCPDIRA